MLPTISAKITTNTDGRSRGIVKQNSALSLSQQSFDISKQNPRCYDTIRTLRPMLASVRLSVGFPPIDAMIGLLTRIILRFALRSNHQVAGHLLMTSGHPHSRCRAYFLYKEGGNMLMGASESCRWFSSDDSMNMIPTVGRGLRRNLSAPPSIRMT